MGHPLAMVRAFHDNLVYMGRGKITDDAGHPPERI